MTQHTSPEPHAPEPASPDVTPVSDDAAPAVVDPEPKLVKAEPRADQPDATRRNVEPTAAKPTKQNRTKKDRGPALVLGRGKQERYENELRSRLGLLPLGLSIPTQLRIKGWLVTLAAGLIAAITRLVNLDYPTKLVFDETYYVKGGWSLLRFGYEKNWTGDDVDKLWLAGDLSGMEEVADRVVHPPFGKWVIAFGMRIFGDDNGLGWRFSSAFLGILAVMITVRIALRLFRSPLLAGMAGLFMALDGMGIVLSRTSLLDNILAFFVLLGFWAVLKDRDWSRARLAHRVARSPIRQDGTLVDPWGPNLWYRPWLLLAGVLLGLSCGVKWSGAYAVAVFGIFIFAWGTSARKAVGARLWVGSGVFREGIPAFVSFVPTAIVAYLAQWYPWFRNPNSWDRQWAVGAREKGEDLPFDWAPDAINSFIHYHQETWKFHVGLSSPHTYQSDAWAWLIQFRPVSFFWDNNDELPPNSCPSGNCVSAITSVGNPFVWWLALAGLAVVIWAAFKNRDWRAWAILAGYIAMWLPWMRYYNRTIFQFYAIAFLPFVVLALVYALAYLTKMLPPPHGRTRSLAEVLQPPPLDFDDDAAEPEPAAFGELTDDDLEPDDGVAEPEPVTFGELSVAYLESDDPIVRSREADELHDESWPLPGILDLPCRSKSNKGLLIVVSAAVVIAAIFWMPLWLGTPVPYWFWKLHMWLPTWI